MPLPAARVATTAAHPSRVTTTFCQNDTFPDKQRFTCAAEHNAGTVPETEMQTVPAGQQQNKDDVLEKTYVISDCCLSFWTCGGKEELRLYAHTVEYKKVYPCCWWLFCLPPCGPLNFACILPPCHVYRTKVPYSKIKYVQHDTNCWGGHALKVGGLSEILPISLCWAKDKANGIYEDLMFKATPDSPGKALSMSRN